jgi:HAMP domain-containing protein
MADAWIGVIGTLIGVAAGGGITYFVTQAQIEHTEKLERSRRQIAKLEATHELFSKVSQHTHIMNLNVVGNLTHGIKIDFKNMGEKLPLDELQMHADMYIPEVSNKAHDITNKWMDFGRVLGEVMLKPTITDDERGDYIIKSTKIATEIDRLSKEAKQIVVKNAKKYL